MARKFLLYVVLLGGLGFLFGYALDRTPPPWWDEGWTLTVARTWVEQGTYARLLDGELAPPGLESAFPTAWLAALSMRVFGVGLVQARLVSVILTWGALAVLWILARRLYSSAVAWATLGVLFLMTMHPHMHVVLNARQLLGEAAMLLGLTAGLVCLLYLESRAWLGMPVVGLCWGVALLSKGQPIPFLLVATVGVVAWGLLKKQFRLVALWLGVLIFTYGWYAALGFGVNWFLAAYGLVPTSVNGLFQVVALVTAPAMRVKAFTLVLEFGLLTVCGVVYGAVHWFRARDDARMENFVRLWLWLFVASWLIWFLLLANSSIPRYLYPPTFFGAMFAAALLDAWTNHFDVRETLRRATGVLRRARPQTKALGALAAILLLALTAPFTGLMLLWAFLADANDDAARTAAYLNSQTAPHARIETYDAELFFFLNRPYHYPPDQMHVEYIRRTLEPAHEATYDALAAQPDYLVVGPFSREWRVYDTVLAQRVFAPTVRFGAYQIYERAR